MQGARRDLEKQIPDIQQIRESLEHQLTCKMEAKVSLPSGKPAVATWHFTATNGSQILTTIV